MKDDDLMEEATRDIAAAKAELLGRRDQLIAEYDERLDQLGGLAAGLEGGEITAKVAQDRVRQLLGERASVGRGARAGRTQIGMRLPASAAAAPSVAVRAGPTPATVTAAVNKMLSALDGQMVEVLTGRGRTREEARLELSLLRRMRQSLQLQLTEIPQDVVLLGSLVEFTEEVQATLADLQSGGGDRLSRLLQYDRELAAELVALGGKMPGIKDQLKRTQALLGTTDPDLGKAMQEAVAAFARLHKELQRRIPSPNHSLLDELLTH